MGGRGNVREIGERDLELFSSNQTEGENPEKGVWL